MREQVRGVGDLQGAVIESVHFSVYDGTAILALDGNRFACLVPFQDFDENWSVAFSQIEPELGDLCDAGIITEAEFEAREAEIEVEAQQAMWERDRKELARLLEKYPQGVPSADEPQSEA